MYSKGRQKGFSNLDGTSSNVIELCHEEPDLMGQLNGHCKFIVTTP